MAKKPLTLKQLRFLFATGILAVDKETGKVYVRDKQQLGVLRFANKQRRQGKKVRINPKKYPVLAAYFNE